MSDDAIFDTNFFLLSKLATIICEIDDEKKDRPVVIPLLINNSFNLLRVMQHEALHLGTLHELLNDIHTSFVRQEDLIPHINAIGDEISRLLGPRAGEIYNQDESTEQSIIED